MTSKDPAPGACPTEGCTNGSAHWAPCTTQTVFSVREGFLEMQARYPGRVIDPLAFELGWISRGETAPTADQKLCAHDWDASIRQCQRCGWKNPEAAPADNKLRAVTLLCDLGLAAEPERVETVMEAFADVTRPVNSKEDK